MSQNEMAAPVGPPTAPPHSGVEREETTLHHVAGKVAHLHRTITPGVVPTFCTLQSARNEAGLFSNAVAIDVGAAFKLPHLYASVL